MKQAFAMALLGAAVMAAPANLRSKVSKSKAEKKRDDPAFLQFVAENNKDVRKEEDFDRKQKKFHENLNIINA